MMISKKIKNIIKATLKRFFYFKLILYTLHEKKIIIFDIDNTLANTWPSFNSDFNSTNDRLINLPIFINVAEIVSKYISKGHRVVFLSARNYTTYFITKKWLNENGFIKFFLFIVETPSDKLRVLNFLKKKKIIFYDDLSFGHEKGKIEYYEKEIIQIKKMQHVLYFGYDFLLKLQNNKNQNEEV